jgi:hypothetical protein
MFESTRLNDKLREIAQKFSCRMLIRILGQEVVPLKKGHGIYLNQSLSGLRFKTRSN